MTSIKQLAHHSVIKRVLAQRIIPVTFADDLPAIAAGGLMLTQHSRRRRRVNIYPNITAAAGG